MVSRSSEFFRRLILTSVIRSRRYYTTHITEDGHALSCTWIDGPQGEDAGEHGGVTALQVHFNEFKDRGVVMHYDED